MKIQPYFIIILFSSTLIGLLFIVKNKNHTSSIDKKIIETIFNRKAEEFPDEKVIKISIPRNDIKITIQDMLLDPFMGVTTWFAFQQGKNVEAMVMGDIVLQEHEVSEAMNTALDNNIQITALHNHFFFDNPKLYFMHLEAEGKTENLAQACMLIMQAIKSAKKVLSMTNPSSHSIDGSLIEKIIGVKGQAKNGMFKVVIGRTTKIHDNYVGKNMGINTWAAFGGNNDNAFVDGDFVVLENELQGVLKSLVKDSIKVVAIHNHMILENPRLIFLHFWGQDTLINLAQGIKNALDQTETLKREIQ